MSRGEWRKHGFATSPALLCTHGLVDGLPRVHASSLTAEEFAERFERPRQPVVLTGLCDGWRAAREWTPDRLLQRLGHCKFKVGWREGQQAGTGLLGRAGLVGCRLNAARPWLSAVIRRGPAAELAPHRLMPGRQVGSDDDGYAVRLKLKHFLSYCRHPEHAPADDSPLYIFAHLDQDREEGAALLQDYQGGGVAAHGRPCPCCVTRSGATGARPRAQQCWDAFRTSVVCCLGLRSGSPSSVHISRQPLPVHTRAPPAFGPAVPHMFAEDLMRLAGERRRPPYRWFVMGPARSGTAMHVDPLATSAWNALLQGGWGPSLDHAAEQPPS